MNPRRFCILTFLLMSCFLTAPRSWAQTVLMTADAWKEDARLEQKVSVVYQGGPMNELLARLVKESKVELSAAPNAKEDLIVLMVTEQPLSTILPKIAKHFNFEWERSGEKPNYRYRLYQTAKAIEDEKAAHAEQEGREGLEGIRKRIDTLISKMDTPRSVAYIEIEKLIKEAEAEKDPSKRREIMARMTPYQGVFEPDANLALSLIKGFTAQDWKKASTEEGLVFSTHPWGEERPLPPTLLALAQKDADQQTLFMWQRKQAGTQNPGEAGGETPKTPEYKKLGGFKVRFSKNHFFSFLIRGAMFDDKQECIYDLYFYVWLGKDARPHAEWFNDRPDIKERFEKAFNEGDGSNGLGIRQAAVDPALEALKKDPATDPVLAAKIKLPDEVLKTLNWSMRLEDPESNQQAMNAWSAEFYERLKKLDRQEPLEWSYSPVLKNVHEQTKLNVISDGFDSYVRGARISEEDGVNPLIKAQNLAEILNAFLTMSAIDSTLEEGWLTFRSLNYASERARQTPRPILRKWAKRFSTQKKLSLDELTAFAVDLGERGIDNYSDFMLSLLLQSGVDSFFAYREDMELLRLYATLTPGQKETAKTEKGLLPSEMSPQQQAQYRKALFTGSSLEINLRSLVDPLQNVDPSKLNLTLTQKGYSGYNGHLKLEGDPGEHTWEMNEEEYQTLLQELEEAKNDPESAGYQHTFEKGNVTEETLTLAADTRVMRKITVKTFQPADKPVDAGDEKTAQTEKTEKTEKTGETETPVSPEK